MLYDSISSRFNLRTNAVRSAQQEVLLNENAQRYTLNLGTARLLDDTMSSNSDEACTTG